MEKQVFRRKLIYATIRLFVVAAFAFSITIDTLYLARQILPGYSVVVVLLLSITFLVAIWELATPVVKIEDELLTLYPARIIDRTKRIDLKTVQRSLVTERARYLVLSTTGQADFTIPLKLMRRGHKKRLIQTIKQVIPE